MKKGWVRLHRQIEDNPLYFLEPFTKSQAWMDLFLFANHSDGFIDIRGNVIKVRRGQIAWSELTMTKRWKWSKNKVRRFLSFLETEQQIVQQKFAKITTIITILNYEQFQNETTETLLNINKKTTYPHRDDTTESTSLGDLEKSVKNETTETLLNINKKTTYPHRDDTTEGLQTIHKQECKE